MSGKEADLINVRGSEIRYVEDIGESTGAGRSELC